jgi:hypothetical protein
LGSAGVTTLARAAIHTSSVIGLSEIHVVTDGVSDVLYVAPFRWPAVLEPKDLGSDIAGESVLVSKVMQSTKFRYRRVTHLGSGVCIAAVEALLIFTGEERSQFTPTGCKLSGIPADCYVMIRYSAPLAARSHLPLQVVGNTSLVHIGTNAVA